MDRFAIQSRTQVAVRRLRRTFFDLPVGYATKPVAQEWPSYQSLWRPCSGNERE